METTDKKLELQKMLAALDPERLTKEEFVQSLEAVVGVVNKIDQRNISEFEQIREYLTALSAKVQADTSMNFVTHKNEVSSHISSLISSLERRVNEALAQVQDGIDGKDADEERIVETVLARIPKPEPIVIPEIDLTEINERIAKVEEGVKRAATRPSGWGAHPLVIQDEGTAVDKIARVINFKGAGVTATRTATGVVNVTIAGGGGASFETPTGTVNDTNLTFTVANTPLYIIVNGIIYFSGTGVFVSYAGGTITLNTPVGTGGFIRSAY
jgi:hypothetical protein